MEAKLPPERDSPAAQAGSEPQVSHEIDATIHSHRDGPPALLVGEEMATPLRGGTTSSNPLSSGSQSVSLVPSAATGTKGPAFAANVSLDETRERDMMASNRLAFAFFL